MKTANFKFIGFSLLSLFFLIFSISYGIARSGHNNHASEFANCDKDIEPPSLILSESITLDCFFGSLSGSEMIEVLESEGGFIDLADNCTSYNDIEVQFVQVDTTWTGGCSAEFCADYTYQAVDEAGNISDPETINICFNDSRYPDFGEVYITINGVILNTYFFGTSDGTLTIDLSNEDIVEISEDEIGIGLGDDCNFEGPYSILIETEIDPSNQIAEFTYELCDGCGNCAEFVIEIEFPYIEGCTDENACNYNPFAAEDDGSCNYDDADGDGICDADEIPGCTTEGSCNYNPEATDDDGSCTEIPEENCTECNDDDLVLIDADDDGICDAYEGCTDAEAENYDPEALDDDGSCVYQVSVSLLDITCDEEDAQVLQVTDAQSILTFGGEATRETRTIYAFQPDEGAGIPTYEGLAWPYVLAPVGFSVDDANVTADITVNDDNILLINGWPAYQYYADEDPEDTNGIFGPWLYFSPDGDRSQDACIPLSTSIQSIAKEIEVFPNPAKTSISVLINEPQSSTFTLKLLSVEGRKLYQETLFQNITSQLHNLELIGIPSGVYMLRIESTEGLFTNRIIIQK